MQPVAQGNHFDPFNPLIHANHRPCRCNFCSSLVPFWLEARQSYKGTTLHSPWLMQALCAQLPRAPSHQVLCTSDPGAQCKTIKLQKPKSTHPAARARRVCWPGRAVRTCPAFTTACTRGTGRTTNAGSARAARKLLNPLLHFKHKDQFSFQHLKGILNSSLVLENRLFFKEMERGQ